jgi:heat shock protein HslJ
MVLALLGACAVVRFDAAAPASAALGDADVFGIEEPGFHPEAGVRLADGAWQGEPFAPDGAARPGLVLLHAPQAAGDLDGDGAAERAALLASSSGGSGERIYLGVFAARDGKVVNRATVLVGDRVKPRSLAIEDRSLVLEVIETGPGQPACCGTQLARIEYRLERDVLRKTAHTVQGVLSLAVADGEWVLIEQDGAPLPPGARAPTLAVAGNLVAGFGGCNRYRGELREAAPGEFVPGPHALMATRMACEPPQSDIEDAFLAALGHARRFGFAAGQLRIEWQDGERRGVLLFAR